MQETRITRYAINCRYITKLTDTAPMRKSEVARDKINRFEDIRSRLSMNIAQNTNPLPRMEIREDVPRKMKLIKLIL